MGNCRIDQDTLKEISRVQAFFELKGNRLTHNQIIVEGLDLVKRKHKIPEEGEKQVTEIDLMVKRNLLRKRGIEYKSWVLAN